MITHTSPTDFESKILNALINAGGRISKDDLIEIVYPDPDTSPLDEKQAIHVHISHIRKKLKSNIKIETACRDFVLSGCGMKTDNGFPTVSELTGSEAVILNILLDKRWHTIDFILSVLYENKRISKGSRNTLVVYIHSIKKKLNKELMIERDLNRGYRLR